MRIIFAPILFAVLSACAGLTPQGLLQALRFDPLTTDPATIEVAAALDQRITLAEDGLHITIALAEEEGEPPLISETVALDVVEALSLPGDIAPPAGHRLWRARFSPEGAQRFAAAQQAIIDQRAGGVEGVGSLSISIGLGCVEGGLPQALPLRSWLLMEDGGVFVPFSRSDDLFANMTPAEADTLRAQLSPNC